MQEETPELLRLGALSSGERLRLIDRLIRTRTLPATPLVSYSVTGQTLPVALAGFYELLPDPGPTLGAQNRLLTPGELKLEDGKLVFAVENQYVYSWSTEPEGDDPPVYGRFEACDPWEPEGTFLSTFLVQFTLFELMMSAPLGASVASIAPSALEPVLAHLQPVDAPPWQWPSYPGRFYFRGTTILFAAPNVDEEFSVWIGSESRADISFLTEHVDDSWEYVQLGDES